MLSLIHIFAPTKSDRAGEATTSYAYDAASKSVTLKYNDGNGCLLYTSRCV